jgi:hypothetical protein
MASEGVEKYSLAIQFIFLLWIILKILQRAYSFSVDYNVISKIHFYGFIPIKLCSLKRSLKFCFQYLTQQMGCNCNFSLKLISFYI